MTPLETLKQQRAERYAELEAWHATGFRTGGTTGTAAPQESAEDMTARKRAEIAELDRLIEEQEAKAKNA